MSGPRLPLLVVAAALVFAGCSLFGSKPDEKPTEGGEAALAPDAGELAPVAEPGDAGSPEGPVATPDIPDRPSGPADAGEPEVKVLDPAVRQAFDEGMRAAVSGDPEAAIARFQAAATADPRTYWAHYNLAVLYERKGDDAQAESAYLKALDQRPRADRAAENYGRMMVRTGRAGQAEVELKRRVAATPDALGLRNALAWSLYAQDKLDEGAAEAKKVLKNDEQNVSAMFVLANIYFKQGRTELANMVLDNASHIDPNRAEIFNLEGVILLSQKRKAAAMEKFRAAAALREDLPEAHNNLGAMLLAAQSFPDAARELELAVRYAPRFAAARLNLGNAYRGLGEVDKAKAEYDRALKLDPKLAGEVYFNYGILFLDAEMKELDTTARMEQALAYFAKVKEAGSGDEAVERYVKDANKAIEREKRKKEREEKDKLRRQKKAEEDARKAAEAEAKRKADEEQARIDAEKKAAEDAKRAAELEAQRKLDEEKARVEAEKKAAEDAKNAAALEAQRQAAEEKARLAAEKKAAAEAKKAAALEAQRQAAEEKARLAAEKKAAAEAQRAAALEAKRQAAEEKARLAAEKQAAQEAAEAPLKPASKLGEEDEAPAPAGEATPPSPRPATQGKITDD